MRSLPALGVTFLLVQTAWASPTANEFERCHQGAASRLQHCLSEAGGGEGNACWTRVRTYHALCRKAVVQEHQRPDALRIEAMRNAERKRQAAPSVRN